MVQQCHRLTGMVLVALQSMKSMMSMQAHLYAMTTSTVVPQHVGNVTMARYTTASRRALAHRRSLKVQKASLCSSANLMLVQFERPSHVPSVSPVRLLSS